MADIPTITAEELDPAPHLEAARSVTPTEVRNILIAGGGATAGDLARLLSPAAAECLEDMAQCALRLTRRHFGHNINLYVPLYISNYCSSGCAYCGFAADRRTPRRRMAPDEIRRELLALQQMGFTEVLLLTGERHRPDDFDYLRAAVRMAAECFSTVNIETFPMAIEEYRQLVLAGCHGITIYQETYDLEVYRRMHRWGPKQDYANRLHAPAAALAAGMRTAGLGALLGLADPRRDAVSLFLHVQHLQKHFWRAGITVSFPRLRTEAGGFAAPFAVSDRFLAQMIYAFRICLPDVPLVLSTREAPRFRDGMAGVGITKMSIASRTTVGGYSHANEAADPAAIATEQFAVSDRRSIAEFIDTLRAKGLEPVFKNWDRVFHEAAGNAH